MGAQIGGAVTASLTPWIAQRFGWTSSFLAAALLGVAGAIAWLGVDPETALEATSRDQRGARKHLSTEAS